MGRVAPWASGWAWPEYDGRGLLTVPAALRAFMEGRSPDRWGLADARTAVVLLVDGLGVGQLDAALEAGAAPHLQSVIEAGGRDELTSTLPSTTATALVSLSLGRPPSQHGYLGYRLFLRERGCIGDMLRTRILGTDTPLAALGLHRRDLVGGETLLARAHREGWGAYALTRQEFLPGGLTDILYAGGTVLGYGSEAEMVTRLDRLCRRDERSVVFAYWDGVDQACHRHGAVSEAFLETLRGFDARLGKAFLSQLPEGVALLVTADHGHLDCPPEGAVEATEHPQLLDQLAHPPTGEPRLPYLHARAGRLGHVLDYLDDVLEGAMDWMPAGEAWEGGVFGPDPDPRWRPRVGDVVLLPRENRAFTHAGLPGPPPFASRHGGASPQEMRIPLLWTSSPSGR